MSTLNTYNLKSPDSANTNLALDASGNVAIQAGSASAPSVYVTGDANTGLYSPGADQVALTTGGTARLYIDSSGRVGIGTASPQLSCVISNGGAQGIELTGYNASLGTPLVQYYDRNASAWLDVTHRANSHRFNSPSSECARIDSSGRLLVGTSSARANFFNQASGFETTVQVEGTTYQTSSLSLTQNVNDVSAPFFVLGKTRGNSVGGNTVVSSGDSLGTISFQGSDGSELVEGARIRAEVDGTPGANDMPGRLVFSVTQDGSASPTERMRIANAGTCAHFATNDTVLGANSSAASGNTVRLFSGSYNATAVFSGVESFRIWSSGDVNNQNNSYTGISDVKLKENIADASSQWDDIKSIRVRNYNLKEGSTHRQIGVIAQELETTCPGLVDELPDLDGLTTTKSVKYSVLYMKAVKALQEAMERIETLEAKVAALESA